MSRRRFRYAVPVVLVLSLAGASLAIAASQGPKHHGDSNRFTAYLSGHSEVPAVHTAGKGTLTLTVKDANTLTYELTYSSMLNAATFAHVHFAQPNVNGAVSFFLCGGGGEAACPSGTSTTTPVTVSGEILASEVIGVPAQGLPAGNLDAILDEIKAGFAYANIHTTVSPGGEIRGQIGGDRGRHFGHGRGHNKHH